ncbi:MAG TPA: polysaccharide deacetylase family protein [Solirubrobacteraceae bacterium]|jgi:peptidoglycan/xylan/chitin deacetylase (PgdA/CDA1 family)|nr:polysaccharide deacetylase family protein [Solirubrobacteraceae bacterium]
MGHTSVSAQPLSPSATTVGLPLPTDHLFESYLGSRRRSTVFEAYYRLKPAIPRRIQLAMRRAYAHKQAARAFPAWPNEPLLLDRRDEQLRQRLDESAADRLACVGFWPDHRRFACVLTHDVEGPKGVDNIERVLEVERRYGFVSSWNFVAEWYPIPEDMFDRVRAAGGEIGLHGIKHDGRMFESRERFEHDLHKMRGYFESWGAVGFRSPATHRNADWMPELGCLYDSSFPDSDPFEPQPGGCCSIFPFMMGDVVELPITLVQDHTLMEILRQDTIDLWTRKTTWIAENHGLVNLITHPDYLVDRRHLDMYERFLEFLARQADMWGALPRDVAGWWSSREAMSVEDDGGELRIAGDPSGRASVAWAYDRDGKITFDL